MEQVDNTWTEIAEQDCQIDDFTPKKNKAAAHRLQAAKASSSSKKPFEFTSPDSTDTDQKLPSNDQDSASASVDLTENYKQKVQIRDAKLEKVIQIT